MSKKQWHKMLTSRGEWVWGFKGTCLSEDEMAPAVEVLTHLNTTAVRCTLFRAGLPSLLLLGVASCILDTFGRKWWQRGMPSRAPQEHLSSPCGDMNFPFLKNIYMVVAMHNWCRLPSSRGRFA
eukprot:1159181-Pelagomonas_calceolata.AAC.4